MGAARRPEGRLEYAIQPVPGFAGEGPAEPFMGAQAFMVASGAKNKAFAQEFVNTGVNNEEAMQTLFDLAKLAAGHDVRAGGGHRPGHRGLRRRRQRGRADARHPGDGRGLGPAGQGLLRHRRRRGPDATIEAAGKTITAEIEKQG